MASPTTEEVDGKRYSMLRMEPNRRYPRIIFPGFPILVKLDGALPAVRRVLYYSCSVDAHGLRGGGQGAPQVHPFRSPAGSFRVGFIGTGVTFGEGVEDHEVFTTLLQRQLNAAPPIKRRFEVLNFGTPGLTTDYAVGAFEVFRRRYDVDLWIFLLGVNDALPMFGRSEGAYRRDVRRLVKLVRSSGVTSLMTVEPVNTFYPWMGHYRRYRKILKAEVGHQTGLLDLAAILDCHERRDGVRLEQQGGEQRVVQYRGARPRVLASHEYAATGPRQQSISPQIYEYLDSHRVMMRTFITDVHLNRRGHQVVAKVLYQYLSDRLQRKPLRDLGGKGCGF